MFTAFGTAGRGRDNRFIERYSIDAHIQEASQTYAEQEGK